MPKKDMKRRSLWADEVLWVKVKQAAQAEDRTLASWVRAAMVAGLIKGGYINLDGK